MLRGVLHSMIFTPQYEGEKNIQYIQKNLANVSFLTPIPEGREML